MVTSHGSFMTFHGLVKVDKERCRKRDRFVFPAEPREKIAQALDIEFCDLDVAL